MNDRNFCRFTIQSNLHVELTEGTCTFYMYKLTIIIVCFPKKEQQKILFKCAATFGGSEQLATLSNILLHNSQSRMDQLAHEYLCRADRLTIPLQHKFQELNEVYTWL